MDKKRLTGIVIVNWNGWRDTLRCIESLQHLRDATWMAIVVDNASSDDSLEKLRPLAGQFHLIESPVNTGWAGGNNLGIRRAFELGCDRAWLLNNDAVARPDALACLSALLDAEPAAAFVGSLIDHDPPRETFQFAGTRVDPQSGIPDIWWDAPRDGVLVDQGPIRSDFVMGCSMLVARSTVERIGYIDEDFFLNFDETDWCRRATDQGLACLLVPRALVSHRHSASMGGTQRPLNQYFMIRNRLLYAHRHCTHGQRRHVWKMTLWELDRFARMEGHSGWLAACLRPRTPLVQATLIAVRDYLLGRFGDCPGAVRTLHSHACRSSVPGRMQVAATSDGQPIETL